MMETFDPVERAKEKETSRQLDEKRLADGVRIRNGLFDVLDKRKAKIIHRRVTISRLRKLAEKADNGETINITGMTEDQVLKVLFKNDSK